ncbi:polysaccharide biosynthesis protein [Pseudoxanthomonas sp. SL93]|jgi:FMN phosphatase YigB (HAD superfamily)|uniref:rhamnan synthesis F family protein n=1 Tax=Pseudoxanthomonas sp. SL93 TaxID=2995142 RepID=UPI00226FDE42|nr:rhamnan synthesis F family protein [Pseudoxanthomonas sp. SL93]WAC63043.1 polysaccharide biosynthesis protein [Pseudoxanthomonas sp. SL93]
MKTLEALLRSYKLRGGGARGLISLLLRAYEVTHALGFNGFVRWVRGATHRSSDSTAHCQNSLLAPPTPLADISLKVGVVAHIFYEDLADEFVDYLSRIPLPFELLISTTDESITGRLHEVFGGLPNVSRVTIRVVENRGRDIAPLLVEFHSEVSKLDLICHIHTKKSLYTGMEQHDWRRYLLDSLLGSPERISWITGLFDSNADLGMVYPETFTSIPLSAHTWLSNAAHARLLGRMLRIEINPEDYIDFPAGSMFWSRVSGLRPLFDLDLRTSDFPIESGQTDGTLHHAIERLFAELIKHGGQRIGVMPQDGKQIIHANGSKNWAAYFSSSVRDKIQGRSQNLRLASFDIYDTLVTRAFLTPSGARAYFGHLIHELFSIDGFTELRSRAESVARAKQGSDVSIHVIYAELEKLSGIDETLLSSVRELELQFERRILAPRPAVIAAAAELGAKGVRVIAISDMYLGANELKSVLPGEAGSVTTEVFSSCETATRKDDGTTWDLIGKKMGVTGAKWLHVGDNELADVHKPLAHGLMQPIHVLRPNALVQAVPALRSLQLTTSASWQDQLWVGLVARRLTRLADENPRCFGISLEIQDPELAGYLVLGPLLVDYLAWLARHALSTEAEKIVFLSREGYLLKRGYEQMRLFVPSLDRAEGIYLLASRRSTGMASLQSADDVTTLLQGSYEGSLHDLLVARMGRRVAEQVPIDLTRSYVTLPEQRDHVVNALIPSMKRVLEVAAMERETYLHYWNTHIGTSRPLISDVGYSGTIQSCLSRLTGTTMNGAYFGLTERARSVPGNLAARYHDERLHGPKALSPLFRHDILLESMLTAPQGQLLSLERNTTTGDIDPVHAEESRTRAQLAAIEQLHTGACAFIKDVGHIVGGDILQMDADRMLVQQPLDCLGSGKWKAAGWGKQLSVDDHHTGRGVIYPTA